MGRADRFQVFLSTVLYGGCVALIGFTPRALPRVAGWVCRSIISSSLVTSSLDTLVFCLHFFRKQDSQLYLYTVLDISKN